MTIWTVEGHRLFADGRPVPFRASPNIGGEIRQRFLVLHFTAGGEAGAIETLTAPGGVSAHLVLGEAGNPTQLVDFGRAAWHAGRSRWADVTGSLNPVSIGIEIANLGDAVTGSPGAYRAYGRPVPDDRVVVARHVNGGPVRPWHSYPEAQIEAVIAIGRALHAAYRFEDVVGHDQIAPDRKVDPGPAFPFMRVRAAILGAAGGPVDVPSIPASDLPDHSVMQMQRALNRLGFGPLDVDGSAGPKTLAALRAFQASHGLAPDGRAGPKTWAAIDAAMTARG